MKVIGYNALVKEEANEEVKSSGGIIISTEKKYDDFSKAEVIAVGEELKEVSVGDTIVYRAKSGTVFNDNGEIYRVLSKDSILAVI